MNADERRSGRAAWGVCAALAFLVVLPSAATGTDKPAESAPPTFSIAISAATTIEVGSPAVIHITVTNISNHAIAFDSEVFGERDFHIEVLDAQGSPPPETQYMKAIRGEDQGPGPIIVLTGSLWQRDLKPGETVEETTDLNKLFDLKPGTYTVQLWRPDFQMGHVTEGIKTTPGESDLSKPMKPGLSKPNPKPVPLKPKAIAKSNVISLTVTP